MENIFNKKTSRYRISRHEYEHDFTMHIIKHLGLNIESGFIPANIINQYLEDNIKGLSFENCYIIPRINYALSVWRGKVISKNPANKIEYSIYLDLIDALGYVGEPYFEIYNLTENEGNIRFLLNETDKMCSYIDTKLK